MNQEITPSAPEPAACCPCATHGLPPRITEYQAPAWLPGGDLQTIYPYFFARVPHVDYRRERWELPDGDFLDLDWVDAAADAPLMALFHGLEGNSRGFYALAMMNAARHRGWRGVVVHFRGCSGEPNRLPRAYFAGDSAEIDYVLKRLKQNNGQAALYAAGVSLGGNALLKWLGEAGETATAVISRAVAISAPVDLTITGRNLDKGINRYFYTAKFLSTLKQTALQKLDVYPALYERKQVEAISSLYAFDDLVTAPLHGYKGADDYWRHASSKPGLIHVRVPTLLINARNDPFMPGSALPRPDEVSSAITLDFPAEGGHVGFLEGPFPGNVDWLPQRSLVFFETGQ
ncbi:MAG TPA: hydrolase [Sulfuriferula sp.]|nr:hydrolase [Sulfuriferula sp.]